MTMEMIAEAAINGFLASVCCLSFACTLVGFFVALGIIVSACKAFVGVFKK